tara:strand:+ start:16120 stop:18069 length:1950 start_codon:yes stop_codon:yes gene_type:complete
MDNKILKERLVFESSYPNTLALLLENEEDVEKSFKVSQTALDAIDKRLTKINNLIAKLPPGNYKSGLNKLINDVIAGKVNALIDASKNIDSQPADLEKSAKQAGVIASEVDEASKNLNHVIMINVSLIQQVSSIIVKGKLHLGEDKDIALIEIFKEAGDNFANDAALELLDAFDRALKNRPKKEKGFFSGLADKIFGSKEDDPVDVFEKNKESLVNSLLDMSPMVVASFAKEMINYGKEDSASAKETSKKSEEAAKVVEDEAGSVESTGSGLKFSRKDLENKIVKRIGKPGIPILSALEKSGLLNDLGITVESSLKNQDMNILFEKTLSSKDFNSILASATEESPELFQDTDASDLVDNLNGFFSDENIDITIDKKAPEWADLDGKGKRRAKLSFFLAGEYKYGGTPSLDTMDTLLFTYQKAGLNAEDLADTDVDINNYFSEENGKGAQKLRDIPELVTAINSVIESNEEYSKFKLNIEASGDDEANEDIKENEKELKDAAKTAVQNADSPTSGAMQALDDWESNLSNTSRKQLQAKNRIGQLKDMVKGSIEDAAKTLEGEVEAAVDLWVEEHEETLIKSKRFSKKNFDSLKNVIPQIVSQLATKESRSSISTAYIRKTTFKYLNNKFTLDKKLNESRNYSRLRKLAGI